MYWEGDKGQAMRLAKLLADLEPEHSKLADILFVSRFDCAHSLEHVRQVSRKFNVYLHVSKRRGTGWPRGCNSLFFGMLEWAYHKMAAGQVPNYKAIFVVGPDGAPIKKNWLQLLTTAWDVANKKQKIYVAGAMVDGSPEGKKHINGDAMMLSGDLDFLKWLTLDVGDIKIAAGWDWILAGAFEKRGWRDFPFIKSIWRRTTPFKQEDWDAENTFGTIWYHGIKNDDLLNLSRKNLVT